jgi:thiol-disulfide isomerase/thioredoxin
MAPRLLAMLALAVTAGFFAGRAYWTARQSQIPIEAPTPTTLPAIRLQDLGGATRSISEWTSRSLIINFWATWCAPCRKEMPLLEQLHQERSATGITVIGIAIDREDPVRAFVGETGITYPILFGEQDAMAAAEAFGPSFLGLPFTVVTAPGGEILKLHVGELHPGDLQTIVSVLDQLARGTLSVAGARKALQKA